MASAAAVLETVEVKPGITKEILQYGIGEAKPAVGDEVTAHYTGRLLDGTVFDSSVQRGRPFKVGHGASGGTRRPCCWRRVLRVRSSPRRAYQSRPKAWLR